MKDIAHRPLFWFSLALLLAPTVWLAIDMHAMWGLARVSPSPPDNGRIALVIFAFATSYGPGLVCLFVAIFGRRNATNGGSN